MSTVSSFMQIDVPGATDTQAQGINDAGQIVRLFSDSMGGHGFLDTAGTFTTIDVPSAIPVLGLTGYTYALGVNNAGQIVGRYSGGRAIIYFTNGHPICRVAGIDRDARHDP